MPPAPEAQARPTSPPPQQAEDLLTRFIQAGATAARDAFVRPDTPGQVERLIANDKGFASPRTRSVVDAFNPSPA